MSESIVNLYLFNKTHIVYDRCRHQAYLIKAANRMDALLWVARKNKYSEDPLLENFIKKREPIIVDRMAAGDSRLELIERGEFSSVIMLDIGVEVGAIKEAHLENFIVKNDDYVYSLVSIAIDQ